MSYYDQTLHKLKVKIRSQYQLELSSQKPYQKIGYRLLRWVTMIRHEFARDEIGVRAESLSYFTLFSLMPLLAGSFLLLGIFSQWSPVQAGFEDLIERFMQPIPDDYRDDLIEFLVQFKNDYLQKISAKSSSIGIFALFVLMWIGAKVFFNIENLMNRIWNTEERRPWIERIQNLVFCAVVAPLAGAVAITLPGILNNFGGMQLGLLWEQGLPSIILFLGLLFVFRYFPNTKVKWRSAMYGAIGSSFMFTFGSLALKVYFHFGTQTAYGKLSVVPILAFFIYVFWVIFILGAEISFLMQNPHSFVGYELPQSSFAEAVLMVEVFRHFKSRFHLGKPAVDFNDLNRHFKVGAASMMNVLTFLNREKVILEATSSGQKDVIHYSLARELNEDDLLRLIKDYLHVTHLSQRFDVQSVIHALNTK